MRQQLGRLGGQLGVGLCLVGFLLVFLGWNGAASRNFLPAQFPYLISGGITGLCLVVVGTGTIVVQNQRADRAALQKTLEQLIDAVEHSGGLRTNGAATKSTSDDLVAGRDSYHRADCRLAQGRAEATPITVAEALERGLEPCRVCNPPKTIETATVEPATAEPAAGKTKSRRGGQLRAQ
jgi:hypothetical protein